MSEPPAAAVAAPGAETGSTAELRAWLRREPALAAMVVGAAIATIVPVWIGRHVPLLAPSTLLAGVGQKLLLSATLLTLPVAAAIYARRMGRDPRLALFAFPLAWNCAVANGLVSLAGGVALLLLGLAAIDRYAERPSVGRGLLAAALGTSLHWLHPLPWAMFLVIGGAVSLLAPRPWSWRRALLAPLPALVALAGGLLLPTLVPVAAPGPDTWTLDLAAVLKAMPDWLLNLFPDQRDEVVLFLLGATWLLMITNRPIVRRDGGESPDLDDGDVRSWRLELSAAIAFAVLFVLPRASNPSTSAYPTGWQAAPLVAILAALAVRGPLAGARRPLLYAVAFLAIAWPLDVAAHYHRFNLRAGGFDVLMAAVPPGKRVLPLIFNAGDRDLNVNPYSHWASDASGHALPAPPRDHPEQFRFVMHGEPWDYFLVRGPSKVDPFTDARDRVRRVAESGEWSLWEKVAK